MNFNWDNKKIGDIVDIRRGASPRPIHNFLSTKGMPWVKIADATSDPSRYIWGTNEYIINEGVSKSVKVDPETLIVSNSATPGLPKIMKIEACVHDGWLVFSNYRGVTRDFLYYKFIDIRRMLVNQANGSVFQNLKTDIVRDFNIKIPSIDVQNRIVNILSKLDEKIELNSAINANLEEQAQAIYHNMFINLSNSSRHTYKAEEFFSIGIGKTPPRKEHKWFTKGLSGIKWVSIADMGNCGTFIAKSSENLTQDAIEKFNIKIIPDNTVILSFKLTVGRTAITHGEMTSNEAIAHFKTDNPFITEYLYCYLKNFNFQTMGNTSSIATAVNSKIIKAMPFILPEDGELRHFYNLVHPLFEQIKNNQLESELLEQMRDALLPRLMSGELNTSKINF